MTSNKLSLLWSRLHRRTPFSQSFNSLASGAMSLFASHTEHAIEPQPSMYRICTMVAQTWPWQHCRHKHGVRLNLFTSQCRMFWPRPPYSFPIWHNASYIDTFSTVLLWQSSPCPSQWQRSEAELTHSPPFPWDSTHIHQCGHPGDWTRDTALSKRSAHRVP